MKRVTIEASLPHLLAVIALLLLAGIAIFHLPALFHG